MEIEIVKKINVYRYKNGNQCDGDLCILFSELIQTERSHCRTLMIMQRVFARGMMEELHMSKDMVERIFPSLDEMIDIHLTFLHRLTERQKIKVHNQSNSFL